MKLALALLLVVTSLAATPPASAQEDDDTRVALGAAVISSPRPYVGADNDTQPIPIIEVDWGRFFVYGIVAGYRFVDTEEFSMSVRIQGRFGGFEEDDSPFLEGMEERKISADVGIGATRRWKRWGLSASVFADALDRSNGVEASTGVSYTFFGFDRRLLLTPELELVWSSSDLLDFYYGVRPEEARPGRPAYSPDDAIDARARLLTRYRLTAKWSATLLFSAGRLPDEVRDSPIVEDDWSTFALLGASYEF